MIRFTAKISICFRNSQYTRDIVAQWLGGSWSGHWIIWSRGRGFDSGRICYQVTTLGKLFTLMCLCHQALQFSTRQEAMTLCGWEGNLRSGIALAMGHRLSRLSTYGLNGLEWRWAPSWALTCCTFFILAQTSSCCSLHTAAQTSAWKSNGAPEVDVARQK